MFPLIAFWQWEKIMWTEFSFFNKFRPISKTRFHIELGAGLARVWDVTILTKTNLCTTSTPTSSSRRGYSYATSNNSSSTTSTGTKFRDHIPF